MLYHSITLKHLENGQGIKMTKVIATYECGDANITVDSSDGDITGQVLFVNGMLAHVLRSELVGCGKMALSKARYNIHKVIAFEHITNARGH